MKGLKGRILNEEFVMVIWRLVVERIDDSIKYASKNDILSSSAAMMADLAASFIVTQALPGMVRQTSKEESEDLFCSPST